jgi:small subunit ribosomal protein S1
MVRARDFDKGGNKAGSGRSTQKDDFAALLEASYADGTSRAGRRLEVGQVVEGAVIQIAKDSVFLDIGTPGDARIPSGELTNSAGELTVKIGQRLRATVVDARADAPLLAISIGRGGSVDVAALESAMASGTTVEGRVTQAVKGGLEIDIAGVRAFCPASQVELGYAAELESFVGRTLEFKVLEIRDGGRSVVVSRRARLAEERHERERDALERLAPGAELEGTVHAIEKHGAVVDLGGIEGFVHISELAERRVDRIEDVVRVGETVKVRVLSVEESPKGLRVRLSMKALKQPGNAQPAAGADEVLAAKVVAVANHGVFVETSAGEGLVPVRELALSPGADHRRAYPVGREFNVVLLSRDAQSGKLRFSATGVSAVEERKNYREFSARGPSQASAGTLGSLGDVLRGKLSGSAASASGPSSGSAQGDPPGVVRRRR